jgi:hypothetical protein
MKSRVLLFAVAGVLSFASSVPGQSLAEVARQEQARRKTVKQPSKVYTNKDLRPELGGAQSPAETVQAVPAQPAAVGSPGAQSQPSAATPSEPATTPGQQEPVKDEAYWRDKITGARAGLEETRILVEAMQSRINALTADFAARDDPAQRAVIANDRAQALAALARLQDDFQKRTQAISDIEEEARRAGVPPGWLR